MEQATLDKIKDELQKISPFEWLCVKREGDSIHATYVVTQRKGDDVDLNDTPFFYRTVNLSKRCTVNVWAHPELSAEAAQALYDHYSEEYVLGDGMHLMYDFIADHHHYINSAGQSSMPKSDDFGKCVYYADVDELHMNEEDWISLTRVIG